MSKSYFENRIATAKVVLNFLVLATRSFFTLILLCVLSASFFAIANPKP